MSLFRLYFELGLEHILDVNGYDHILFVVALCAIYSTTEWKKVLILVTAFTVGHSITLALATVRYVNFDSSIIEFLIPVTILITSLSNLFVKDLSSYNARKISFNYLYAGFFGLIHGLGFSNYLKQILSQEDSIVTPLFAFNIGLEVGQIIIVLVFMAITFIAVSILGISRRDWKFFISSAIAGVAIMLMLDAKFW
ncbi:MAG: HupE/UreJ family protein [bacterium]|nr:HupE/UreJ family protein [bacterium]